MAMLLAIRMAIMMDSDWLTAMLMVTPMETSSVTVRLTAMLKAISMAMLMAVSMPMAKSTVMAILMVMEIQRVITMDLGWRTVMPLEIPMATNLEMD